MVDDYYRRDRPMEDYGWAHFAGGEGAWERKLEFIWPLRTCNRYCEGRDANRDTGEEYPSTEAYRFGQKLEEARRLPGHYLLTACKQ